jgi:hypothetical protein
MTATRAPRRHAMTTISPPPDWWADAWVEHQLKIRLRIRELLKPSRSGPPRTRHGVEAATALWLFFRLVHYSAREIETALEAMIADGVVTKTGAFYSLSSVHECPIGESS